MRGEPQCRLDQLFGESNPDNIDQQKAIYTSADVFSGSGAVTTALKKVGFRVVVAIDNDPLACRTYRLNHPDVDLLERDVLSVSPDSLL